ncbi:MAG: hypothetical protein HUU02_14690 [Bacteroidetes bacterium]|nr:hypothetical protein [Bacteroidota bacterium]
MSTFYNKLKLVIPIILVSFLFIGYLTSNEDFLPIFKYREVTEWTPEKKYPRIEVYHSDDKSFRVIGFFSANSERMLIKWDGDTVNVLRSIDGVLRISHNNLRIQDTTIATITENKILPNKMGKTKLFVSFQERVDTLTINIDKIDGELMVYSMPN